MTKGIIISLVVVVVIVGAGYYLARPTEAPSLVGLTPTSSISLAPSPSPSFSPVNSVSPTPVTTPVPKVIMYTNSGYSPATLKIKKGETVTWQNSSSSGMWTASAIHPTHKVYPGTDIADCGAQKTMFDSCAGTVPGKLWTFRFDNAGTWKYHNHSNSSHTGTVIVE